MPTPFFHFKQFTVWHDQCAMKVGTDGVLLGALAQVKDSTQTILDIGSGSGLVALMLAQRCESATITAIDIDEGAFRQTLFNFSASPWSLRLTAAQSSVQEFSNNNKNSFDLIVSNPPFFTDSLKNPDIARSTARHNDTLSFNELLFHASLLINKTGSIVMILPVSDKKMCVKCAENYGLYCCTSVVIFPKPGASAKRVVLTFSKNNSPKKNSELTIETDIRGVYTDEFELTIETDIRGVYTDEFTALVRNYYLNL